MSTITSVDTDDNSKYVLTGSSDKTAKLWDAKTGALLKTFRIPIGSGQEGLINAGAISPDGSIVAIAGNTGWSWYREISIYIYSVESGKMINRIGGLQDIVLDLEFSQTGSYLAASLAGTQGVFLYSSEGFQLEKQLSHGGNVYNLDFDQNNRMATVSYDGYVRIFSPSFELLNQTAALAGQLPFSVSFSSDGKKIAVGYNRSSTIQVFNSENLNLLYEPDVAPATTSRDRLFKLTFSANGKYLYAGGVYQSVVDGRWQQIIRRWEEEGQGAFVDIPVGSNTIMDIKRDPNDGVIFATSEPEFGKINSEGDLAFFKKAEINSYRSPDNSHFKLNNSGNLIGFTPLRGEPLTFSLLNTTLKNADLDAPGFKDAGESIQITNWKSSPDPIFNGQSLQSILQDYENVHSVDINESANLVTLGADWNLYALDNAGNLKWNTSIQSPAFATKISGDGKIIATAHGDGILRWFRAKDGELLLSLFTHPDNNQWIIWTPTGYYDASNNAEELVGWYINNGANTESSFYPIDRFFETYYRPDIIKEVIKSNETDKVITSVNDESVSEDFKKPPMVEFATPDNGVRMTKELLTIKTKITDQGGGIDEVRLFHNGKHISSGVRGLKMASNDEKVINREFSVRLLPGENVFRLTAFNKERVEANPVELTVNYTGAQATADLYMIAVGINQYKNESLNLNYGKPDAESFVNIIRKNSSGIFRELKVKTFYDSQATRENVLSAFEQVLQEARPEDAFLFFYAGHGVMSSAEDENEVDFYMALHNVIRLYGDNEGLEKEGISAAEITELTRQIKARKQMITLDACQSGGVVETFSIRGASEQKAILQLARSAGLVVMASTGTEQYATEFQDLGHGVFTYALLQGLGGQADGGSQDGKITVKELDAFINDRVPALTQKHRGQTQYPNSYSRGQDFPIVVQN